MRIQHLLFDLDGTLVDYWDFPLRMEFIGRTILALRGHADWRKVLGALRTAKTELDHPSKTENNLQRTLRILSNELKLPTDQTHQIIRNVLNDVFPKVAHHFSPIPGAQEFLEWARGRYTFTLATNPVWPPELIYLRLKWGGIDPTWFPSITHAERMHAIKPSLNYYREVLEQEKFKPENCLLVGNERENDLPARFTGIKVFLYRKKPELISLKPEKGGAQAWKGNYRILRDLLTLNS